MVVMDLGGGGAEPVSVAQAKIWCRIDRSDEDALIGALVAAARETVEREIGLVLVKREFRLVLDRVPEDRRIAVPKRPFREATSVTAIDADGVPRVLPGTAVVAAEAGRVLRLSAEVAAKAAEGVEIEFRAGFEAEDVPEALRLAVKQIVAAAYELRGAVALDMQPGIVPKAARDLIAPFRERRL